MIEKRNSKIMHILIKWSLLSTSSVEIEIILGDLLLHNGLSECLGKIDVLEVHSVSIESYIGL